TLRQTHRPIVTIVGKPTGCNPWASRTGGWVSESSDDHLHLDTADLDNIVGVQRPLLPGVDARPVDEGTVGAIEVFNRQLIVLETDTGVLPRAPDAVGRLLFFQVDVDRLLIGATDEVEALVDRVLDVPLLAAQHQQARLGP